ncbi:MAG: hypothetical protein HY706_10165 [Candidatus Hydrogenedentes bacterium]|nr:hypothetical protein [Candidatus Hydrogenedentota bacterium]
MTTITITLFLLIVLAALLYGLVRSLIQSWLDYRLRVTFLERTEKDPDVLRPLLDNETALARWVNPPRPVNRQDYALTGLFLGLLGAVGIVCGFLMGGDRTALGVYLGGVACMVLGLLLALFGLLLRSMRKSPTTPAQRKP